MDNEIPTPRTNAAKVFRSRINNAPNSGADSGAAGFDEVVTVDFARTLERELAAAQSQNAVLMDVAKAAFNYANRPADTEWGANNLAIAIIKAEQLGINLVDKGQP